MRGSLYLKSAVIGLLLIPVTAGAQSGGGGGGAGGSAGGGAGGGSSGGGTSSGSVSSPSVGPSAIGAPTTLRTGAAGANGGQSTTGVNSTPTDPTGISARPPDAPGYQALVPTAPVRTPATRNALAGAWNELGGDGGIFGFTSGTSRFNHYWLGPQPSRGY